ncbi:S8 family serine peptidase [Arabiibacter massiliensis]|uniref:S8 family serine peptidase n=1 Tax=Arabiibacter massiliensis TaxID=1870985 RepID=UPI0009BAA1BC|nr:S8 family serine peptidase [Arabiibacter massiliensis]
MKRLLSLVLALALSLMAVPALAEEPPAASDGNPRVGSGEGARTLEELLGAGDYEQGRVLARVTDEFAPVSSYSNDAPAWSAESLYSYGAAQQPASGARSFAAQSADQVLLIESDELSTEELLLSLADVPGVVCAEPDYVVRLDDPEPSSEGETAAAAAPAANAAQATTNDPLLERQWQLSSNGDVVGATNARELWAQEGFPGASHLREVVVAVIDTGVDCTHPDLVDSLWVNDPDQTGLPGVHGYDFFHGMDDPRDDDGHGTHVAGIVAATANNNEGGAGVAPNAKIMGLRIANEEGGLVDSLAIDAYSYMKQAAEAGVPLVAANNSWGGGGVSWLLSDVMEDLYRTEDIVSFCASGNYSIDHDLASDMPSSGTSEGIVAVDAAGRDGALSSFSDYGAATTDIAAPGVGILSTVPAALGMVDPEDAGTTPVRDDFEDEPGLFSFEAEGGDGVTTAAVRTDAAWAGSAASGHSVRWTVSGAHEGQKASLVLRTQPGAVEVAAGGSVDDLRFLAFNAKVADSKEESGNRLIRVSLRATDGEWLDITPKDLDANYGAWKTSVAPIPDEVRGQVDWGNFAVKLSRNFTAYDEGLDLEFGIDDVSLSKTTVPYDFYDGTSMASPAAAGAYALLAGVFADEDAETLRARLLGGVRRTDALSGTCTTDGMVDVMRAATNPYPVVDALECAADGSLEATVRGSWFGSQEGRVLLDGEELSVAQWGEDEIRVTLPASLESKRRYVEVVRAEDGETGRRQVLVGSEEGEGFYESLPAPDLESLGLARGLEQNYPWKVAAAGGKVYAACDGLCRSDGQRLVPFYGLLVYDPADRSWALEEALEDRIEDPFLLCSHGDVLYVMTSTVDNLVYTLDTSTGAVGGPIDGSALNQYGLEWLVLPTASSFCDGRTFWVCGGGVPLLGLEAAPLFASLDLETGESTPLPPLGDARFAPAFAVLDGVPTVAAGNSDAEASILVGTVERLVNGAWEQGPLPSSLMAGQYGQAAWGVLPAGSTVEGAKAAGERLVIAGLNEEGLEGSDTWVYDPTADSWQALSTRLAATKVSYAGGAVLGDAFYVLGVDAIEGRDVFKRLTFEPAPEEPGGDEPGGKDPAADDPADGKDEAGRQSPSTLADMGDAMGGAAALLAAVACLAIGASAASRRKGGRR